MIATEEYYKKILSDGPNAQAYNKLGCLYQFTGRLSEALEYQKKAVETEPDNPQLQANLARALIETLKPQQGIELLRKAVEKMPQNAQMHSNLLFRLHYLPELNQQMLFDEHTRWAQIHAGPIKARQNHKNIPDPDRKLRIGYISPDFRAHPVTTFFQSILEGHNHQKVEIYGYANVESPDDVTEHLKERLDCYRNIYGIADEAVADIIEQDEIDILVDLAGHTGDNRLLVLAHKPAPIQVTYLGYPDTTGMDTIDYRLTDRLTNPPQSQKFYSEELIFLPETFACYKPPGHAPCVSPLPAKEKGYITFGSFNNGCKIHPFIMSLWAEILKTDVNWHLLLRFKGGNDRGIKDYYYSHFAQFAIAPERIDIDGWRPGVEHLRQYGQVDIALDTYPLNGHTTTCEALWMGVPTISLIGQCHPSRFGLSVLSCVGLDFFAASTPDEYVKKAIALAQNPESLANIRSSMRARIAKSGLCYAKAFAKNVESAYRKMWHKWCQRQ